EIGKASRCLQAKRQVACALIEGRLTPRQAAAQFQDLDACLPEKLRRWRPPGYTAEEWACRQVIAFVEGELAGRRQVPAQGQAWVSWLRAELRGDRTPEGASPPATGQ